MRPGPHGVWSSTNTLPREDLVRLAQTVERLGYDAFWYPESTAYESLALAGFMLGRTERLALGSGIANIYARDANTAMAGHNTLNALYGDRFILGLGVSHVPLVEGVRGHVYGPPVTAMRGYLERMLSAKVDVAAPARNIVLAALGPKMLALARDLVQGALPYCVTPEHTAEAARILGPGRWLCVEQKICFTTDAAVARNVAAGNLRRYLALTNYRNNWLRLGFAEAELTGSGSERFLDAMVAWGTEAQIRERLDAHRRAGATHVCIQPLDPGGGAMADLRALAAFAPA